MCKGVIRGLITGTTPALVANLACVSLARPSPTRQHSTEYVHTYGSEMLPE